MHNVAAQTYQQVDARAKGRWHLVPSLVTQIVTADYRGSDGN